MTMAGIVGIGLGCLLLGLSSSTFSLRGYIASTVILTAGYAAFQTANNSAVMMNAGAGDRGSISGMLNLSRNLGLITGASLMGALFAGAADTTQITSAPPAAVAAAMRFTFEVAAALMLLALALAVERNPLRRRRLPAA